MDTGVERPRELPIKEFNRATDTRDTLARAKQQRQKYNLDDYLVVDVDAHHFETQSWGEIVERIEDPVIKDIANNFRANGRLTPGILGGSGMPSHQNVGGRITHDPGLEEPHLNEENLPRDVVLVRRAIDAMGVDYQVLVPLADAGARDASAARGRGRDRHRL